MKHINFKEKFGSAAKKIREFDWKKLISTKAFIVVGCLVLVCVAVLVSSLIGRNPDKETQKEESNRLLGNTLLVDSEQTPQEAGKETETENGDFFAMSVINRTKVRDSALEVLREIAQNPDTLPDAKEDALSSIAGIADDMTAEANIETLIKSKGIADCIAVINKGGCSVIVNTEGLLDEELVQITDIVFEQTNIPVSNITVVEAKKRFDQPDKEKPE